MNRQLINSLEDPKNSTKNNNQNVNDKIPISKKNSNLFFTSHFHEIKITVKIFF